MVNTIYTVRFFGLKVRKGILLYRQYFILLDALPDLLNRWSFVPVDQRRILVDFLVRRGNGTLRGDS
jgi:hypothetical protein